MDWDRIETEFQAVGPLALEKALRDGDTEIGLRALGLATKDPMPIDDPALTAGHSGPQVLGRYLLALTACCRPGDWLSRTGLGARGGCKIAPEDHSDVAGRSMTARTAS